MCGKIVVLAVSTGFDAFFWESARRNPSSRSDGVPEHGFRTSSTCQNDDFAAHGVRKPCIRDVSRDEPRCYSKLTPNSFKTDSEMMNRIDYIWVTKGTKVKKYAVLMPWVSRGLR